MSEPLRLLAFADLHGKGYPAAERLIDEYRPDWLVLLGDILPDFSMIQGRGNRLEAQRLHWQTYRSCFVREGMVTTFVRGNHEIEGFSDPLLSRVPGPFEGKVVRLEGIPADFGTWGWAREWEEEDLESELDAQLAETPFPLLYLSHVPPFGCRDWTANGDHIGHRPLQRHLQERDWPEAIVLCGHVHESFGEWSRGMTQVINLAGGYAWLEGSPLSMSLGKIDSIVN